MSVAAVVDLAGLLEQPAYETRFRCVACRHRSAIGRYDHHCSAGGRICEPCVAGLPLPVRRLIDRYGISTREAQRCVSEWGTDAKRRLDLVVCRLGGNPDRAEWRCIETLVARRHLGVEAAMSVPNTSPHHCQRGGYVPLANVAMTQERRMALSEVDQRQLLASEYGSMAR